MALDHYVSRVHLKNFYSPALGERMYAVRKSNGKAFTPNAESVCRIEEGSTNAYLTRDRAIETFLKGVEPQYNAAVKKLAMGEVDPNCVAVIAAFAAYIMTCSPAAMRIQSLPLRDGLDPAQIAGTLDAVSALPPAPAALGGGSLTELLQSGKLQFEVDPKYPQAIGIANILKMTLMLGNSSWDVLRNPFEDCPFFTSDFPAAIEESDNPNALNRIVPLTPNLAVRIRRNVSLPRDAGDFTFPHFHHRIRRIGRKELNAVNRLIVRCAEDLVFYRDEQPWVRSFIEKNASCRVETEIQTMSGSGGVPRARLKIIDRG